MPTRVLTKMYTKVPTKVDVLCVILHDEGGVHGCAHKRAHENIDSAHFVDISISPRRDGKVTIDELLLC